MIVLIHRDAVKAAGIEQDDTEWGIKLRPVLEAKKFPMRKVYEGSTEISYAYDGHGGVFFADMPGGHYSSLKRFLSDYSDAM